MDYQTTQTIARLLHSFRRVSNLAQLVQQSDHPPRSLRLHTWTDPEGLAKVLNTLVMSVSTEGDREGDGREDIQQQEGNRQEEFIFMEDAVQENIALPKLQEDAQPVHQEPLRKPRISKKWKNKSNVRGPYNNYQVQLKQQAVDLLNSGQPVSSISRRLSIPAKNIKRWQRQGVFRKMGAGRKRCDPQMEENLNRWIRGSFNVEDHLPQEAIRKRALELTTQPDFKASKGWLTKFCRRYRIRQSYQLH